MEQINRIELLGIVGSVRLQAVGDRKMARFTVVTNRAYKNKEGEAVIETTWHNVTAFEGRNVQNLEGIEKGRPVKLTGRLRIQKVTAEDGTDRTYVDVVCTSLALIPTDIDVEYEM